MPSLPTVSVIIPTYNRADFLPTAIKSVLDQTYPYIEIIVVDDGSTDDTGEVIKKFKRNVQYVATGHKGAGHARNTGMKAATGKYIAFLDSDDTYLPYKLDVQVSFIEAHPEIGMVCSEFMGAYSNGEIEEFHLKTYHNVWKENNWAYEDIFDNEHGHFSIDALKYAVPYYIGNIFEQVLLEPIIPSNTVLFPKSILSKVGYQDETIHSGQDYHFVAGICKYYSVAFLNVPTYVIMHHKDQLTKHHYYTGKKQVMAQIKETELMLKVTNKWAYEDKGYYRYHKEKIDSRLSALYCRLGKKWLQYGDIPKARECLQYCKGFGQAKLNYKLYRSILNAPFVFRWLVIKLVDLIIGAKRRRL
jgi:glycosyltransferase involved in cell wall biosynthesis